MRADPWPRSGARRAGRGRSRGGDTIPRALRRSSSVWRARAASGAPSIPGPDRKSFWGIVLILIGLFELIERTELFSGFSWLDFSRRVLFQS